MFLFLFSILPVSLIVFFILTKEKKFVPISLIGAIIALFTCGFNAFFLTSHRLIPVSVFQNCVYYLHRQTLFPILIIYGIFLIVSKDSWDFKFKSFYPLFAAFYTIYMPFFFLKGHNVNFSTAELFIYPLLQFFMLFTVYSLLIQGSKSKPGIIALDSTVIIFYLIIPAYLESLYLLNEQCFIRTFLTVLYILIPCTGCICDVIFHKSKYLTKSN